MHTTAIPAIISFQEVTNYAVGEWLQNLVIGEWRKVVYDETEAKNSRKSWLFAVRKDSNDCHKETCQFRSQRVWDAVKLGQQMVENICPMSRWSRGPAAWQAAHGDAGRLEATADGSRLRRDGVARRRDCERSLARPPSTSFDRVNNRERRLVGQDGSRTSLGPCAAGCDSSRRSGWDKYPSIEARTRSAAACCREAVEATRNQDAGQRR